MSDEDIVINVEVKLDTEDRISEELADLLFNCGLEILRLDGNAIIVNQTDIVRVGGDLYAAIGLGTQNVDSLDTALSEINAIDEFHVEDGFVLVKGDGVVIDEPYEDEIRENAKDVTAEVVSLNV